MLHEKNLRLNGRDSIQVSLRDDFGARMAVSKFVAEVACAANLFGSYLEHTIDPGGRL